MKTLRLKNKKKLGTARHHPWLYSGAVESMDPCQVGDTLAIQSAEGKLVGYAHRTGGKSIVAKIFAFTDQELRIDDKFWMEKFHRAWTYRKQMGLVKNVNTDSYRLFYSEGDELPGLTCDIYGSNASVHIGNEGFEALEPLIAKFLKDTVGVTSIFVKDSQGSRCLGAGPKDIRFEENGLHLISLVEGGQKTGYFLDQKENRLLVSEFSKGKTVLDAFCYLGGFGLNALKGGAKEVHFLDASKLALHTAERNVHENFSNAQYRLEEADCFYYLRKMPDGFFDLIVLDPPAFAKRPEALKQAARAYKDINMIALKKIRSSGFLFTFSCSHHMPRELFRTVVYQAALDAGRSVRVVKELSQAPDHPANIFHPEGDYLKGLMLYVD